eukprot:UN01771
MSLMDHLKQRLKARNSLMSGKSDPSLSKKESIKPPPTLHEDDGPPQMTPSPSPKQTPDRTGLGLSNVPQSMRTSMLLLDEPDEMSSGSNQSWGSDDD